MLLVTVSASSQLSAEQQAEVESLQKIIKSAEHDTIIINAWMDWDNIIYLNDPDLDFELNQKIDSLCQLNLDKTLNQREIHLLKRSRIRFK